MRSDRLVISGGDIELRLGAREYDETIVGVLSSDGAVLAGTHSYSRERVGAVDLDGVVWSGTRVSSLDRVGSVDPQGVVSAGRTPSREETIGEIHAGGSVLRGHRQALQRIGSVHPADRRAGAALLLLIDQTPRPTDRTASSSPRSWTSKRDGSQLAAFAAGALAGAAAQHTHAKAGAQQAPQRRPLTLMEILQAERLRPGSQPQNRAWVPGAVTHQSTPEADIVRPTGEVESDGETFVGEIPSADGEAARILAHMRSFSDHEAIDGQNGLATQWKDHGLTLQELRMSYKRYLDLKDLAYRFMTTPRRD